MNKTNDNSDKNVKRSSKRSDEHRSLNAAKEKLPSPKVLTYISQPDQEKPDFVFIDNTGNRNGIEHFRIDISIGIRKNSGLKITEGEIKRIFHKYHKDIENHLDEARKEIGTVLNRTMREWQNFNYQTFYIRFNEILEEHYLEVEKYKAN